MKTFIFVLLLSFASSSLAEDFNIEHFAQQLGTSVSALKHVENLSKARLDKMCKEYGCAPLKPLFESCTVNELVNSCVMKKFYTQAMVSELCGEDTKCMNKHYANEQKFISFYQENATTPGFGRVAINTCSPLHKYHTNNEKTLEIERELGVVEAYTMFYDFTPYFECISETYKKLVVKSFN